MRRTQFLLGAGLGLATAVLAACTTYGKKPEAAGSPQATGETPAPAPATANGNAIAKTADVAVGSGVIVDDIVVTQPTAGDFKGFSAVCTHAGCSVSSVANGTINCPCHGSKFNLDGTVASGPASRPLDARSVTVQGDSIVAT